MITLMVLSRITLGGVNSKWRWIEQGERRHGAAA